ncbi:hypothetical protein [Tateyamaria sp. ANG-S1]|uniref:hypothetical protein n=1 Tax=Tateyamaria sp. ANG-S1 TaxID=1577905 RepID=UPI00057E8262|nr:hypothetical protein [Tateyamaria sp. ANG-S1]KIC50874.1 hypothetical protein RA29_02925 [Tateyamaria sp. ANG-S1]
MRLERFIHAKPEDSNFSIWDSLQAHITGARKSKAAKKDFLHAFLQYPTDLELNSDRERLMLRQAVEFINLTYGGKLPAISRVSQNTSCCIISTCPFVHVLNAAIPQAVIF